MELVSAWCGLLGCIFVPGLQGLRIEGAFGSWVWGWSGIRRNVCIWMELLQATCPLQNLYPYVRL